MTRRFDIVRIVAMALVAVAVLGVVTPVCAMPDCKDAAVDTCSDFTPACDDCPDQVLMKHSHDEAAGTVSVAVEPPVSVAALEVPAEPMATGFIFRAPEATASPPPLDPLGVRLTI